MDIVLRRAVPEDANAAVPLIHSSGPAVVDYIFAARGKDDVFSCLRRGFERNRGELGYAIHTVAVVDGAVVGTGTAYSGSDMPGYMVAGMRHILGFYGIYYGVGVIRRALQAERLIRPPARGVHYVAHIGVDKSHWGRGIGARMVRHLLEEGRRLGRSVAVLDVSSINPRAQALYERLGFVVTGESVSALRNQFAAVPDHRRMELKLG